MSVTGIWDLTLATPLGGLHAEIELHDEAGRLTGSARGAGEEVPLRDVVLDGDRLTWSQSVTKPLRLNLDFDVTVSGTTLAGTSRAGRLPRSRVTGTRRAAGGTGVPAPPPGDSQRTHKNGP
ncbi:hypothetical protein [Streptomyces phytohabitans]|uniref:hypothetical protein n=1 Tax=Streptomyces phytohabitans TaxID=1150371 RepID=UPI00345BAA6F